MIINKDGFSIYKQTPKAKDGRAEFSREHRPALHGLGQPPQCS
jgi:hypothetical protein